MRKMFPFDNVPDSKFHGASMGPTWVLSAPDGPHVGPMKLAIRGYHGRQSYPFPTASVLAKPLHQTGPKYHRKVV